MKNVSISFRLTLWFSAVFLSGFAVFGLVMWADLAYSLSKGRDHTLSRRAERTLALLRELQNDPPGQRQAKFDEFFEVMPEGNLIHVLDQGGRWLYPASPAPPAFPWPNTAAVGRRSLQNVVHAGRGYRVLAWPVFLDRPLCIVVAGQLEDNRLLLSRFSLGLRTAIPALLAVSALGGYFISRRALRPVGRLTGAVRSISIGNLSERLPVHRTGDELQRLAETCNEMLGRLETAVARVRRFTADASHELRSPICFICSVTEYALRRPDLDAESRATFEDILAESSEASRLLEAMLTLARADAGQLAFATETVNLRELVEDVCEKARPSTEAKSQTLVLDGRNGGRIAVRGDRPSLRRLLWTLLDNAVKYTPEHGRIDVTLERNGSEARVKVQDNGIGIPAEMLPRVFERFFRVDPSRSEVAGAGLGLAIAKWIADAHHASLSVQSQQGEGSVFTFVLPLDR